MINKRAMNDTGSTKTYYVVYFTLVALTLLTCAVVVDTARGLACHGRLGNRLPQSRTDRVVLHAHFDERSTAVADALRRRSVAINFARPDID